MLLTYLAEVAKNHPDHYLDYFFWLTLAKHYHYIDVATTRLTLPENSTLFAHLRLPQIDQWLVEGITPRFIKEQEIKALIYLLNHPRDHYQPFYLMHVLNQAEASSRPIISLEETHFLKPEDYVPFKLEAIVELCHAANNNIEKYDLEQLAPQLCEAFTKYRTSVFEDTPLMNYFMDFTEWFYGTCLFN